LRYGRFDDDARAYEIERPDTPLPWINYLGGEEFSSLISNTAGGYAFYRDARLRRLTRFRYHGVPADTGSRFLYVRDRADGDVWCPTGAPGRAELEGYRCRHGLGTTAIGSRRRGVGVETTFVVPLGRTLELWRVRVTNHREVPADLDLVGAVEFCLWDAQDDATNLQRNLNTGEVEVVDGVVYHVTEYRERRDHFAWFASSETPVAFDTQREAFLGPYRGWDRPATVEEGRLRDSVAHGWAPIGALQIAVTVAPDETRDVLFALGYAENPPDRKFHPVGSGRVDVRGVAATRTGVLRADAVDAALEEHRSRWDGLLGTLRVETPDPHVDRMVNVWNPYQCIVTFALSRSASYFETGIGRGMGFRDSNQDVLGYVHLIPERARARLLDLAATQLPTGGAYHQYQPLTKRGNDQLGSGFNDDPLWLVVAAGAYLRETGERAILDEAVPYANEPGTEEPLLEHLRRALGYTLDRRGPHGLPLIGHADWNDCLNLNAFSAEPGESFQLLQGDEGTVAESVFIAGLFCLAAAELAEIEDRVGDGTQAERWREARALMSAAVGEHGWDGAWFLRAYDASGAPVGSSANEEGRIYVEPQGMCPIGGIGLDDGRAATALASVGEHLATEHGTVLLDPPYTRYHLELGEISSYPPGYKENGSVFCHTNPWIAIAQALVGDDDGAFETYRRINPSVREELSDVHRCEPYVYAQTIAGKAAPTFGEAKNSWLTGTAAWNLVAITQWILGIRPEHDGLRIDPRLPSAWDGYHAERRFRGATYRIEVRKPVGATGRASSVVVDGERLEGTLVPPAPEGAVVEVLAEVEARPSGL
jgi:cellobiose phosphorylase